MFSPPRTLILVFIRIPFYGNLRKFFGSRRNCRPSKPLLPIRRDYLSINLAILSDRSYRYVPYRFVGIVRCARRDEARQGAFARVLSTRKIDIGNLRYWNILGFVLTASNYSPVSAAAIPRVAVRGYARYPHANHDPDDNLDAGIAAFKADRRSILRSASRESKDR